MQRPMASTCRMSVTGPRLHVTTKNVFRRPQTSLDGQDHPQFLEGGPEGPRETGDWSKVYRSGPGEGKICTQGTRTGSSGRGRR